MVLVKGHTGLSKNILQVGDKLPVQTGFLKNSAGNIVRPKVSRWAV